MRLLDRYLVGQLLRATVSCLAFLTVMFVVVDSFNNLDEFIQHKASAALVAAYYLWLVPSVLLQIVPVATLVSLLFVLGNLNRHSEITALRASGISTAQILGPYLVVGLLLSLGLLYAGETVGPRSSLTSTAILNGLIKKGRHDLRERSIDNVTLYAKDNRIIFAREFEVIKQALHDVVILDDDPDRTIHAKITAKHAAYEDGLWVLREAMRYELNDQGDIVGEPVHSPDMMVDLGAKPEDFLREASQVDFMSAGQLRDYIDHLRGTSRKLVRRLWVDYHAKVAFPFACLVVILVGSPLAMKHRRGGAMVGAGTSLVVIACYYAFHSVCLAMGKAGILPPPVSAWLSNLAFAAAGLYWIRSTS